MASIMNNTTVAEKRAAAAKDAALVAESGIAEDVARAKALGAEAGRDALAADLNVAATPTDLDYEWAHGEIGRVMTLDESYAFAEGYAEAVEAA